MPAAQVSLICRSRSSWVAMSAGSPSARWRISTLTNVGGSAASRRASRRVRTRAPPARCARTPRRRRPRPPRRGDCGRAVDIVDEDAEPAAAAPPRSAATSPSASATSALAAAIRPGRRRPRVCRPRTAARTSGGGRQRAGRAGAGRHDSAAAAASREHVVVDQRLECRRHRCGAVVLEDVAAEHHATRPAVEQVAGQREHGAVVTLGPATGEVGHVTADADRPAHRPLVGEDPGLDDVGAGLDGLAHQRTRRSSSATS